MLCSSKWVAVQTDCGQCWLCSCYPFDECCCRCGHYLPSCEAYWSGPLQSSTCTGLLSPPLVTINDSETATAKMSSQETEYLHFLFIEDDAHVENNSRSLMFGRLYSDKLPVWVLVKVDINFRKLFFGNFSVLIRPAFWLGTDIL